LRRLLPGEAWVGGVEPRDGEEPAFMPVRWTVLILATLSAAMLAVVALRAEATRVHYELSQLDRRAAVLRQELREKELELARLRNPARIRAKLAQSRLEQGASDAAVTAGRPDSP
jgi:hypothetical protein